MLEMPRNVIYVVEMLQLDRRWRPVASPSGPYFTIKAAQETCRELFKQYPDLKQRLRHARKIKDPDPVRIMPYEQSPIRVIRVDDPVDLTRDTRLL